jgi:hypothetical protein
MINVEQLIYLAGLAINNCNYGIIYYKHEQHAAAHFWNSQIGGKASIMYPSRL